MDKKSINKMGQAVEQDKVIIVKRDGEKVPYDIFKIVNAVYCAYKEVSVDTDDEILVNNATRIAGAVDIQLRVGLESPYEISVEQIQDLVEDVLMVNDKIVARAYIRYRHKHEMARGSYEILMDELNEKISARNVVNQNANVDEKSFGGRMGETADLVAKRIANDYYLSSMAKKNHLGNMIYIHDLAAYAVGSHNCLSIPFDTLLANGFNTRQTDVRAAQSVSTAMQLLAVIFQVQSLSQFGGVSATHLDHTMVPYVRKSLLKHYIVEYVKDLDDFMSLELLSLSNDELDEWVKDNKHKYLKEWNLSESDFYINNDKLDKKYYQRALFDTIRETYQAVEGMYHNLNTLQSRSGNQLPFTSINYGTCTLPEGRLIIKALLEASIKGIGKLNKTSIFPCGIFQSMEGVNRKLGDPNYDLFKLALESTSKRLYPNYANVEWSGNAGFDRNDPTTYFSTMGCRTANGYDINGFGQRKDGRGNICPVTIILPTLAMQIKTGFINQYGAEVAHEDNAHMVDRFIGYLDEKIHEAKDMLIERFEWICSQSPDSAKFMYENNVMSGYVPEEGIRSALKHGTLAIGQLGLAEALQILIGCDHTEERGMELAKRIEGLFKKRCAEFKEEYKLNFGVYYSPAENLCHTSLKKFREVYGTIPNVSDKEFFTNSMHVPVWKKMSAIDKIDIESQLTGYSSAGCITYVELESSVINNIEGLESLVLYAMEKDIPYVAINVPNDMCEECGHTGDINDVCPQCGCDKIKRLRRVTGYLTGDYTTAFNMGKQNEVEMRVKHGGIEVNE